MVGERWRHGYRKDCKAHGISSMPMFDDSDILVLQLTTEQSLSPGDDRQLSVVTCGCGCRFVEAEAIPKKERRTSSHAKSYNTTSYTTITLHSKRCILCKMRRLRLHPIPLECQSRVPERRRHGPILPIPHLVLLRCSEEQHDGLEGREIRGMRCFQLLQGH